MAKLKVQGGTASFGEDLCVTCRWVLRAEGVEGRVYKQCTIFGKGVTTQIVKCSSYQDTSVATLSDMREIAWIVTPRSGNKVGFMPYRDLPLDRRMAIEYPDLEDDDEEKIK